MQRNVRSIGLQFFLELGFLLRDQDDLPGVNDNGLCTNVHPAHHHPRPAAGMKMSSASKKNRKVKRGGASGADDTGIEIFY